jgi:hypothetical protein
MGRVFAGSKSSRGPHHDVRGTVQTERARIDGRQDGVNHARRMCVRSGFEEPVHRLTNHSCGHTTPWSAAPTYPWRSKKVPVSRDFWCGNRRRSSPGPHVNTALRRSEATLLRCCNRARGHTFADRRSVTPEVAGSSPVAPVKIPANRRLLLPVEAQTTAGLTSSRVDPAQRSSFAAPFRSRLAPVMASIPRKSRTPFARTERSLWAGTSPIPSRSGWPRACNVGAATARLKIKAGRPG